MIDLAAHRARERFSLQDVLVARSEHRRSCFAHARCVNGIWISMRPLADPGGSKNSPNDLLLLTLFGGTMKYKKDMCPANGKRRRLVLRTSVFERRVRLLHESRQRRKIMSSRRIFLQQASSAGLALSATSVFGRFLSAQSPARADQKVVSIAQTYG